MRPRAAAPLVRRPTNPEAPRLGEAAPTEPERFQSVAPIGPRSRSRPSPTPTFSAGANPRGPPRRRPAPGGSITRFAKGGQPPSTKAGERPNPDAQSAVVRRFRRHRHFQARVGGHVNQYIEIEIANAKANVRARAAPGFRLSPTLRKPASPLKSVDVPATLNFESGKDRARRDLNERVKS